MYEGNKAVITYYPEDIVASSSSQYLDIIEWCTEAGIKSELLRSGYLNDGIHSVWGIKNEQHRILFKLRWS